MSYRGRNQEAVYTHGATVNIPLLSSGKYDNLETSSEESDSVHRKQHRRMRQTKLDVLLSIRALLIALVAMAALTLVAISIIAVFFWTNAGATSQMLQHANSIATRADRLLSNPDLDAAIATLINASKTLPDSLEGVFSLLEVADINVILQSVRQIINLINRSGAMIDALSDVDPVDLVQFARNQRLLENTARILTASIDLINHFDKPGIRDSMSTMFGDSAELVTSLRQLMAEVHQTGLTVKI